MKILLIVAMILVVVLCAIIYFFEQFLTDEIEDARIDQIRRELARDSIRECPGIEIDEVV
jgi:uncharacterized membrane protein